MPSTAGRQRADVPFGNRVPLVPAAARLPATGTQAPAIGGIDVFAI